MEQAYSVFVDDVEIKGGLSRQDAEDLCKSVAGIVKATTPLEVKPTTQRATQ